MNRIVRSTRLVTLGFAAVCLLIGGCSSQNKANKANFEKIKEGMSVKEVEDIMGPAKASADLLGATVKTWEDSDTGYMVTIKDGKVVTKMSGKKDATKKTSEPTGNDKLTKANADKIKNDMTKAQVIEILGEPTTKRAVGKDESLTWQAGLGSITVTLDPAGKVVAIQQVNIK